MKVVSRLLAPRAWGAHLFALLALVVTVWLGVWQFQSWQATREAEAADLTRLDPVPLEDVFGPDDPFPGDKIGQPVLLDGTWVPDGTVYISGRESDGEAGYWVVTPLAIGGGADASALPIVRGWTAEVDDAPAPPTGEAELVGWLQPGEGTNEVDTDRSDDILPQVRLADLVQHVDQDLYGGYAIVATPDDVAAGNWPTGDRATNDGSAGLVPAELDQLPKSEAFTGLRNFLYAVEWWLFAGFVVFIWVRWARDELAEERAESLGLVGAGPDPDRGDGLVPAAGAASTTAVAAEPVTSGHSRTDLGFLLYRVMASVVGVLLVVLCLVGVPLANFDGTGMWGLFDSTPGLVTPGSSVQQLGDEITTNLGVLHGWLYMGFLLTAISLARRERWPLGFTVVTLLSGTVPILSFWAEHRAVARVRARRDAAQAGAVPVETAATGVRSDS